MSTRGDKKASAAADSKGVSGAQADAGPKAATKGYGIVTNVTSGVSVVISGRSTKSQVIPLAKQIIFSGIEAPKLQRSSEADGKDEPFAFAAREWLREKAIGRQVYFRVDVSTSGRGYGSVTLLVEGKGDEEGENLTEAVIKAGFAKVKGSDDAKAIARFSPQRQKLYEMQQAAARAGRGMFSKSIKPQAAVRTLEVKVDTFKLFEQNRGKPVPAIVDYVISGTLIRCELPRKDLRNAMVRVQLAGVVTPRTAQSSGPLRGMDAYTQYYVSKRVLKRDVDIVLSAIDKRGNLFGSICIRGFPERDIGRMLVKEGLARVLPWTAAGLPVETVRKYRLAEQRAQKEGYGVWEAGKGNSLLKNPNLKTQTMKVKEIVSGDSLVLEDTARNTSNRYFLASVSAPRYGRQREPLGFEAKEFLRSRLINKKVSVRLAYERVIKSDRGGKGAGASKGEPRRTSYVSVKLGNSDIGELLCREGLAKVVPHGTEAARAFNYTALLMAEKKAEAAKKGLFSNPPPTLLKVTDLMDPIPAAKATKAAKDATAASESKTKASKDGASDAKDGASPKGTASSKRRGGRRDTDAEVARAKKVFEALGGTGARVRGIVDYALSGSKFKVYLPKKQVMIPVTLLGIQTPRGPRGSDKGDKYAAEAHALAKKLTTQQNVELELYTVDRRACFVCGICTTDGTKKDVGSELLKQGLAKIFFKTAQAAGKLDELREYERVAKSERVRVWENFDEELKKIREQRAEERSSQQKEERKEAPSKSMNLKVTEVIDGITFYAQTSGNKNSKKIADALKNVSDESPGDDFEVKRYGIYGCKFDGEYCRVQATKVPRPTDDDKTPDVEILYIDYGNAAVVSPAELRPLPEGIDKVPALAVQCKLAGLQLPSMGFDKDTYQRLGQLIYMQQIEANVVTTDASSYFVTVPFGQDGFDQDSASGEGGEAAEDEPATDAKSGDSPKAVESSEPTAAAAPAAAAAEGEAGGDKTQETDEEGSAEGSSEAGPAASEADSKAESKTDSKTDSDEASSAPEAKAADAGASDAKKAPPAEKKTGKKGGKKKKAKKGPTIQQVFLQEGIARLARGGRDPALKRLRRELQEFEAEAKSSRTGMWQFGDLDDDEDDRGRRFGGRGRDK